MCPTLLEYKAIKQYIYKVYLSRVYSVCGNARFSKIACFSSPHPASFVEIGCTCVDGARHFVLEVARGSNIR